MNRARTLQLGWMLVACAAATTALGCDRVGHAIVDHVEQVDAGTPLALPCKVPPRCADDAIISADSIDVRPIFAACGDFANSACGSAVSDGGIAAGVGAVKVEYGCQPITSEAALIEHARTLSNCAQLVIAGDAADLGTSLELPDVVWSTSDIAISSDTPWVLQLERATLSDVFIRLSGPVTLRIQDSAKFVGVHVVGTPSESGEPRLELDQISDGTLLAGDDTQAFHGTLQLARTMLVDSQLIADRIELESVTFEHVLLKAHDLTANDASITDMLATFENAVISASNLQRARIMDCGSLTLLAGEVRDVVVPACRKPPLRVYATKVLRGAVDGDIESDSATWLAVAFGLHESTNLIAWASTLKSDNFCSHDRSARFGAKSSIDCSACQGGLSGAAAACVIPPSVSWLPNFCEELNDATLCTGALPQRMRPVPNDWDP